MKIVFLLLLIGILCPNVTVQTKDQGFMKAIQIVEPTGNDKFQYVKNNELEKILNSEPIKDRYVVVVSMVGRIQTGKSLMLNFFLNYLRKTYNISSPFTNKTYESENWMDMNVKNGFDATKNEDGTTKGIYAWPEIFLHDNVTNGNRSGLKVAIILLDTEGLLHINKNLQHHTQIFSLSTLFSSMLGYSVHREVNYADLAYLDIFSAYTVYGSRLVNSTTKTPFQNFNFIIRDSEYSDKSENATIEKILPRNTTDQNKDMKARIESVFKEIRAFTLPHPGEKVTYSTFDGNTSVINQNFKDKMEAMVTQVLTPENIVIKEINGEQIKARDLSRFLKDFTDVVVNNITTPTSLLEVIANASIWLQHEKYVKLYNDSMFVKLAEIKNISSKPYYEKDELAKIHTENKNQSIHQFTKLVKLGGDEFSAPFEKLLSIKIDECYENIKRENDLMRHKFVSKPSEYIGKASVLWFGIGAIFVVLSGVFFKLYKNREPKKRDNKEEHEKDHKLNDNASSQYTPKK